MREDVREVLGVEVGCISEELDAGGILAGTHLHSERQTVAL